MNKIWSSDGGIWNCSDCGLGGGWEDKTCGCKPDTMNSMVCDSIEVLSMRDGIKKRPEMYSKMTGLEMYDVTTAYNIKRVLEACACSNGCSLCSMFKEAILK